jgi:hypothetical protein
MIVIDAILSLVFTPKTWRRKSTMGTLVIHIATAPIRALDTASWRCRG